MGITIYHVLDEYSGICDKCAAPLETPLQYGYTDCILPELNTTEDLLSIPLQNGSIPDCVPSPLPSATQPLIIAALQGNGNLPSVVLHPLYPGREPSISHQQNSHNGLFGSRFGVPFQGKDGCTYGRPLSGEELLLCYSVPTAIIPDHSVWPILDPIIDALLPGSLPFQFINSIASSYSIMDRVYSNQVSESDEISNSASCYLQGKMSSMILDWKSGYENDPDTKILFTAMRDSGGKALSNSVINSVAMGYRQHLKNNMIQIMGDKLVLFKPVNMASKYITLIITPDPLRRTIFSHYHASPSGGHMGTYKTMFRLRLRFFWPAMREDVKNWVKRCAHCVSYDVWRNRMSELHFSWPITVPFWIMHVDLWAPGLQEDTDGNKGYLMNSMCDISQFIISSPTTDITAAHLAQLFMADVILSFGMCSVVVIDDGSSFETVFKLMCEALGITYWCLSRGNHRGNSVERYHRFLNKTQAIAGNDRGTHKVYIQNAKTS